MKSREIIPILVAPLKTKKHSLGGPIFCLYSFFFGGFLSTLRNSPSFKTSKAKGEIADNKDNISAPQQQKITTFTNYYQFRYNSEVSKSGYW
jgi:hypothetical protein